MTCNLWTKWSVSYKSVNLFWLNYFWHWMWKTFCYSDRANSNLKIDIFDIGCEKHSRRNAFRWDNFWVLKPQKKRLLQSDFYKKIRFLLLSCLKAFESWTKDHEINWKFAHPDCKFFLHHWYSSLYNYTGVDRIGRQPLPKSFTYVSPVVSYISSKLGTEL